jgi:hypothetical protein
MKSDYLILSGLDKEGQGWLVSYISNEPTKKSEAK